MNHTAWDGDASKYDFVLDKLDSSNNSLIQNNEMVLTLTQNGGGTRVSTTRSVLYGTIQASIKTVGVAGVVTAFITMSGVKDEIDFEWTTNNTNQVQSNYYWGARAFPPTLAPLLKLTRRCARRGRRRQLLARRQAHSEQPRLLLPHLVRLILLAPPSLLTLSRTAASNGPPLNSTGS